MTHVDESGGLALALIAHALGRDLQRAARTVGGSKALAEMGASRMARILGVDADVIIQARAPGAIAAARARMKSDQVHLMPSGEFPGRLGEVYDPPFALFARGGRRDAMRAVKERPVIAIVGARRATTPGIRFAYELASGLARRGAVIVSGMAVGIDAAAHRGALDAGAVTVAVLGCGVMHGYPRANQVLRAQIERHGAVLSEYWLDTPPAPWRFPARNRIVAGLAHATVVVEARSRSGALITADFSTEVGRPALAVPGSPWMDASSGCNDLIRAGAAVCCGIEDVINEVDHPGWNADASPSSATLEGLPGQIYRLVRDTPSQLDHLARTADVSIASAAAALAELEVGGLVMRDEAQRYTAVAGGGGSPIARS